MSTTFSTPPTLRGDTDTQLRQLLSYLYQLSETLNIAMDGITTTISGNGGTASSNTGGGSAKGTKELEALKELIISTAEVTKVQMNRLSTVLTEKYEASSSAFGNYIENIESTIIATARDVLQQYGYNAAITALQADSAELKAYMQSTNGFIRQGFVDYNEHGIPIIGIAIGQNLRSYTETIGGVSYEHIDSTQNCAFYTSERVSFRINGTEAAYVSNQRLYISNAQVVGSLMLGDGWEITATAADGILFTFSG